MRGFSAVWVCACTAEVQIPPSTAIAHSPLNTFEFLFFMSTSPWLSWCHDPPVEYVAGRVYSAALSGAAVSQVLDFLCPKWGARFRGNVAVKTYCLVNGAFGG